MKLVIGNRESGTDSRFLVPYLSKRQGYFKIVDREQGIGNREPGTCSLFLTLVYNTNVSKVGNKELVPRSFLTIIGFILVSGSFFPIRILTIIGFMLISGSFLTMIGFILVSGLSISSACKALNDTKKLMLFV